MRQTFDLHNMFILKNLNILIIRNQNEIKIIISIVTISNWQNDKMIWFSDI